MAKGTGFALADAGVGTGLSLFAEHSLPPTVKYWL
jgi:hypothetical protein